MFIYVFWSDKYFFVLIVYPYINAYKCVVNNLFLIIYLKHVFPYYLVEIMLRLHQQLHRKTYQFNINKYELSKRGKKQISLTTHFELLKIYSFVKQIVFKRVFFKILAIFVTFVIHLRRRVQNNISYGATVRASASYYKICMYIRIIIINL